MPAWTLTRSRIATTVKSDPDADVTELRRQLKAERLEDYIRRVVDDAPILTSDQRDHLAAILRPAAGGTA